MSLGALVADGSLLLAIPIAVLAGLVSFLSPCVLPLVPGYLGYIGGAVAPRSRGRSAAEERESGPDPTPASEMTAPDTVAPDATASDTSARDVAARGMHVPDTSPQPSTGQPRAAQEQIGPVVGAQAPIGADASAGHSAAGRSAAGLATTASPAGHAPARRGRLLLGVGLFIAGFTAVFMTVAMLGGTLGRFLIEYADPITRVLGVLIIAMGVIFMGVFAAAQRTVRPAVRGHLGLVGAPLLGVALGIGWTPCIGPTLAVILGMSFDQASAGRGAVLGLAYSLGLGIPFVLLTLGFGWATRSVGFLRRHIRAVNLIGGGVLIALGLLMVSGIWTAVMAQLQGVFASVPLPI